MEKLNVVVTTLRELGFKVEVEKGRVRGEKFTNEHFIMAEVGEVNGEVAFETSVTIAQILCIKSEMLTSEGIKELFESMAKAAKEADEKISSKIKKARFYYLRSKE